MPRQDERAPRLRAVVISRRQRPERLHARAVRVRPRRGALMDHATTNPIETLAAATVEARRFLTRVKPRTLRTEKGRVVTTTEIAENLVRRADLEHAVLPGKRPATIFCADCKTTVNVAKRGPIPDRCRTCARRWLAEMVRAADPAKHRAYRRAVAKRAYQRDPEKHRARNRAKDRPSVVQCSGCRAGIVLRAKGPTPKWCEGCKTRNRAALKAPWKAANPSKVREAQARSNANRRAKRAKARQTK
jgi:hypothetical protein